MSGHNKWSKIKNVKEKNDQQNAKMFTKIGREIAVAVKLGGPDPNANTQLKNIIAKAKELEKHGLLTVDENKIALTVKGFLVSNSVIAAILD